MLAFLRKAEGKISTENEKTALEDTCREYVYYAFLGLTSVLLGLSSPYRHIYIIPFMIILLVSKERNYRVRFVLFQAVMLFFILGCIIEFDWCYDFEIMKNMFWDIMIPFRKFELLGVGQISSMLLNDDLYGIWTIFYSMFVIYILGFSYLHFPRKRGEGYFEDETAITEERLTGKSYYVSIVLNYLITNIAVVLLFISVIRNIINKIF